MLQCLVKNKQINFKAHL